MEDIIFAPKIVFYQTKKQEEMKGKKKKKDNRKN